MIFRIGFRVILILSLFVVVSNSNWASDSRPNFLILLADDCTFNDLPVYGGKNAKTPNIDRLASEGLVFRRAYLSEAMCQPCRAELYTGLYPMANGCAWNHSASHPTTRSMPHYLQQLGYRVGLAGKVHVKPQQAFPFESISGFDKNCVRTPTRPHDCQPIREFMTRDRKQPFCLVVALVEPHVPWVMGDSSKYPPEEIVLPPNIADTDRTRQDYSRYLAEITYMDGQIGEILQNLEDAEQSGNTLVLFSSEQGAQFPGCKWTNWDTGLHTALIARWPGRIANGTTTDALVQYADVLPTLLDFADGELSNKPFNGTSFRSILEGSGTSHRQFVYGVHNNIPEGPAYPIRTISDGTHRYIRNLLPDELYIEKHLMGIRGNGNLNNPYWATWVRESWQSEHTFKLVKRYMNRPAEEFYVTAVDPFEMNNLAGGERFRATQKRLSQELTKWMESQGDPGAAQDSHEAIGAARRGKHLYRPPN